MCNRDVEICDKFSFLTDKTSSIKLQSTHKKMSGIKKMKMCFMQIQYINIRIGIHMYHITLQGSRGYFNTLIFFGVVL